MARTKNRRGSGANRNNSLGVGGAAEGDLQHGERPIVESTAVTPESQDPASTPVPAQGPAPVPAPGSGRADIDIFASTDNPEEPVTKGLEEALSEPGPDPDILLMAPMLPVLEHLAARPQSSSVLRNMVRRLRSMVPADFDFTQVLSGPTLAEIEDDPELAALIRDEERS